VAEIYKTIKIPIPIILPKGTALGQYQACGVLVKANTEALTTRKLDRY